MKKIKNITPFDLHQNIEKINLQADYLYNEYVVKKHYIEEIKEKVKSVAQVSGILGYRPAVNKSAFFLGSTLSIGSYFDDMDNFPQKSLGVSNDSIKSDILRDQVVNQIVVPFLESEDFRDELCYEIMDRIFEIYHFRECVNDFSYGAAQKWINMSIKYYIIIKFKMSKEKDIVKYISDNYQMYNLFPVDGQMINYIHKDFGDMTYNPRIVGCSLPTPQPWSNCNLKFTFIDYWKFVKKNINNVQPLLYEMAKWNPNKRDEN